MNIKLPIHKKLLHLMELFFIQNYLSDISVTRGMYFCTSFTEVVSGYISSPIYNLADRVVVTTSSLKLKCRVPLRRLPVKSACAQT
jgi:hypothetical protein